jgi:hypothetical protein
MRRDPNVGRTAQKWIEFLGPCEVEVSAPFRRGVTPRKTSPGGGFDTTLSYALAHPEIKGLRLVHGRCLDIAHSWVELLGGIVFDGIAQRFYTLAGYRAATEAEEEASYTLREAAQLVLAGDHCGPWSAEEVKGEAGVPGATAGGVKPKGECPTAEESHDRLPRPGWYAREGGTDGRSWPVSGTEGKHRRCHGRPTDRQTRG